MFEMKITREINVQGIRDPYPDRWRETVQGNKPWELQKADNLGPQRLLWITFDQ